MSTDEDDLPAPWTVMSDEDTGHQYYYNTVTGESTWEKPIIEIVPEEEPAEGMGHDHQKRRVSVIDPKSVINVKAKTLKPNKNGKGGGDDSDDDEKDMPLKSPAMNFVQVSKAGPGGTGVIDPSTSTAYEPPEYDAETLVKYSMASFVTSFFEDKPLKRGLTLFVKNYTTQQLLSNSKKLPQPLLKATIREGYVKVAMQFFKNITGYMKDRHSSKKPANHAQRLTINGLKHKHLRDEMFCQIIRQLNSNPVQHDNENSMLNGWMLLGIVLGMFPPSKKLLKFFRCYLQKQDKFMTRRIARIGGAAEVKDDEEDGLLAYILSTEKPWQIKCQKRFEAIIPYVKYCRTTLEQVVNNGERLFPCFLAEIQCVENLKGLAISVKVKSPGGKDISYEVKCGAQTSSGDVVKAILIRTGLDYPKHQGLTTFGLIEEAKVNKKFLLQNPIAWRMSMLDVVHAWSEREEEYSNIEHELILNPRLYFYYQLKNGALKNPGGLDEYYEQAIADSLRGQIPCKKDDEAISLAALALEIHHPGQSDKKLVNKEIPKVLSPATFDALKKAKKNAGALILDAKNKLNGWTADKCKAQYLDVLLRQPLFGAGIFHVGIIADVKIGDWDFEDHIVKSSVKSSNKIGHKLDWRLAISEKGVLFLEEDGHKIMKYDKLNLVHYHASDPNHFWYFYGDPAIPPHEDDCANALVFETSQGRCIQEFFTAYQSLPNNRCKFVSTARQQRTDSNVIPTNANALQTRNRQSTRLELEDL